MIFGQKPLVITMKTVDKEHTRLRDEALYQAYKTAFSSSKGVSHSEAIALALKSPQPRMWVSFYGVYRALLCLVKGSRRAPKDASRKDLLEEVDKKYRMLKEKRIFKDMSLLFIASFIIAEPSTGFYVSEEYAKKIIWRARKQRRGGWKKE